MKKGVIAGLIWGKENSYKSYCYIKLMLGVSPESTQKIHFLLPDSGRRNMLLEKFFLKFFHGFF